VLRDELRFAHEHIEEGDAADPSFVSSDNKPLPQLSRSDLFL
jgi:hypothetical protein